ncbi:MarR family winged helix-turn-helix transcriptional regulator [Paenirhodobacter populi]|uniref:MarR family transcriptional regulator n=1 Tax=Paenirhodobacter populi TaxID=2306993 RepID=A0A443K5M2_9RHOB|nr:MarR family transcriptional regulator [Sinirhodobacter populi]RWR06881.1 MarR family transcriptional regulator [Sinirhodobacter populi]RWR15549.1 MarR family transcriptional regulator [Sinirhodobacter populi]RWR19017.1 MarR family transcriptional regulator [Sinirhodobacter populi]RWR28050.1 MarR family transcriptional regulator [Sinirhodobacter populi]
MDDTLLLESLLRVMRELRSQYDASARDLGLTMARARVVTMLARMEGATQSELAAALEIEPPTLKRQIDALERDGFIERREAPGDLRKRALYLTDRSRAAPTTRFLDHIRAELLQGISPEEQETVRRILDRIADNAVALSRK